MQAPAPEAYQLEPPGCGGSQSAVQPCMGSAETWTLAWIFHILTRRSKSLGRMAPVKDLATPFQQKKDHELYFGLEVVKRLDGEIVEVECRFCKHIGREESGDGQRKKRKTICTFQKPFRTDHYRRHLTKAHPRQWTIYQQLNDEQKRKYWQSKGSSGSGLSRYFTKTSEGIKVSFSKEIIEKIVLQMLFQEDETSHKDNALSYFQFDQQEAKYTALIKPAKRFRLILGFLENGLTFRTIVRCAMMLQKEANLSCLRGSSHGLCSFYARVVCAASLNKIKTILENNWSFSAALDCGNKRAQSFMDIRVRVLTMFQRNC